MSRSRNRSKRWATVLAALCAVGAVASCEDYNGPDRATVTPSHLLKLQADGRGSGTVTAPDVTPELACTSTSGALSGACAGAYPSNVIVRLIATPNAGSTFAGWSGVGCAGSDQCVVDMTQERTVTAAFITAPPR